MTTDQVTTFLQRWQSLIGALVMTLGLIAAIAAWGDSRWLTRAELDSERLAMLSELDSERLAMLAEFDPEELVRKDDLEPIQENVEFLALEYLRDRLVALDGRIQLLEGLPNMSRETRRTLNELRRERTRLQGRMEGLQ